MTFLFVLLLAGFAFVSPSAAVEDEAMEIQRCIWRCLAGSRGPDDPAYQACVTDRCNDKGSEERVNASSAPGMWTYGKHPKLGLTAYVTIGEEAFGMSCEVPPGTGYAGALRMTPGLLDHAAGVLSATSIYTGPFSIDGTSTYQPHPDGFVEALGDVCDLEVERVRKSKELWFLREKFIGLTAGSGDQTVMTLERDGKQIAVAGEADLPLISAPIVVPLTGSTAAINRLLKACPRLRRHVAEGCGSGD
jgi:hypothetical protein